MNICYVTEYFYPFTIGGAEVSTYHHAKALIQAGHRVVIITPNFGAKAYEQIKGIEVYRFFFPNRLAPGEVCNSLYFTNLIYYLHLAFNICRVAFKIKFDVIHAQNTFSIVGAYIASKILRIPFFLSLRDYMSICPVGALCLHYKDLPPVRCSLRQYLECFLEFQNKYHPESGFWKRIRAFFSTMAEIVDFKVRQRALKGAKGIVTVSNAVKRIYTSGRIDIEKLITVYNLPPDPVFDIVLTEKIRKELNLEDKKVVL
jgi:glycosyltransferase involved in cell wall biosynthesis